MARPRLTQLGIQVMDVLWSKGAVSIRQILEEFPSQRRPAYTTLQTIVYRLEAKGALRRTKKIGSAHIFKASLSRSMGERGFLEHLLVPFLGRHEPVMSYLIESGRLTLKDVREAERQLQNAPREN